MANEPIREVVVNGNTYKLEADTSAIETQLTAEDDLQFQFSKSGDDYGYKDANGEFVPFKNPTGTKSITANGTYDVTDYASAKVNVTKSVSYPIKGVVSRSNQSNTAYLTIYVNNTAVATYTNSNYRGGSISVSFKLPLPSGSIATIDLSCNGYVSGDTVFNLTLKINGITYATHGDQTLPFVGGGSIDCSTTYRVSV